MLLEKTLENILTCQICHKQFNNKATVSNHIKLHGLKSQEYYDKFYKSENEGKCKICNKSTRWLGFEMKWRNKICSYGIYCSLNCQLQDKKLYQNQQIAREKTHFERYGVDNPFKNKKLQEYLMQNNIKQYGVPFLLQSKEILEKIKKTNLERYGFENVTENKYIQDKMKQTLFNNYGVLVPCHNSKILLKCQKNAQRLKLYTLPSGNIIKLQGYEPYFLDYIFKNNLLKENEILSGFKQVPKIKYQDENNITHYYFPDFYIFKWNLIIEIKSNWSLKYDWKWKFKEFETRKNYNLIVIIDNKFEIFLDFIKQFNK